MSSIKCYFMFILLIHVHLFYVFVQSAVFNVLRLAVGRAGEIGLFRWNDAKFQKDDECFQNTWCQPKTGKVECMTFVPDASEWCLDFNVSMAGYLITNPSKSKNVRDPKEKHWIFPWLKDMQNESVSKYVTKMLKRAVGVVQGINNSSSSHHIRYGATDDMSTNEMLDIVAILLRGAWSFEGDSAGFIYFAKRRNDLRAARALAGHKDVKEKVFSPSIDYLEGILGAEEYINLLSMTSALLDSLPLSHEAGQPLYPYRNVLMGAVLENLESIISDVGKDNTLVKAVFGSAERACLEIKRLFVFGTMVCNTFYAMMPSLLFCFRTWPYHLH